MTKPLTEPRMDTFTRSYFETALWSSTDESNDQGGDPLDKNYSIDDIDPETRTEMISDCADFQEKYSELLVESGMDFGRAGHNFWLSRNGHGAGFFDDDQDELQEAAKSYGEFNLYVSDGVIYGTPLSGHRTSERRRKKTRLADPEARRSSPQRRWGPCPFCGATGWTTSAWKHGNPLFHHDRPQGGRCLQALEAEKHGRRARVDPHNTVANNVRDYIAVDSRGRTLAGPFKGYSDAKHAAGPAGHVEYVRETGTAGVFEVDEAPGVEARPSRGPYGTLTPPVPASGFGKEQTPTDILARIEWERWAADVQRRIGHEALAQAHDLTRVEYEKLLRKKTYPGEARPRPKAKRSAARRKRDRHGRFK